MYRMMEGDVHFVIFPARFYIESSGTYKGRRLVRMVKKRLKKTAHAPQTQGKRPYDAEKRKQYYSFGIFVGDY
jgi:hypothetical protein